MPGRISPIGHRPRRSIASETMLPRIWLRITTSVSSIAASRQEPRSPSSADDLLASQGKASAQVLGRTSMNSRSDITMAPESRRVRVVNDDLVRLVRHDHPVLDELPLAVDRL